MANLAVLAFGLGAIPLAALILYGFRDRIEGQRAAVWGGLVGVLAFLGVSHAMSHVLEQKPFLFSGSAAETIVFLVIALFVGGAAAWFLFEGRWIRNEPSKVAWGAIAFLALHSLGDGLVLGRGFVGGILPQIPIEPVTISATVVHRFVEGSIVVVAVFLASWRLRSSVPALFPALLAIPAAYAPGLFVSSLGLTAGSATTTAVSAFLAAAEAAFTLILILRGVQPVAATSGSPRWIAWALIGFVAVSFVHFLVE